MKIAAILTCFNRKDKTVACLSGLLESYNEYNSNPVNKEKIELKVFLTDDGCTDGTSAAVIEFKKQGLPIVIVNGDGSCYWAGGMRLAWRKALSESDDWDFFLLLNDDVKPTPNCFDELLKTHCYSLDNTGKAGLYSGVTYSFEEPHVLTYSGCVWTNKLLGTMEMLDVSPTPQRCDVTNANILLVDKSVYKTIGIFHEGFIHGGADHDYSHQANKAGFPVWVTAQCCGFCDDDHANIDLSREKLLSMSLRERKKYFSNPVHCIHDYILGTKRRAPQRWLLVAFGRYLNVYAPRFYYFLFDIRSKF